MSQSNETSALPLDNPSKPLLADETELEATNKSGTTAEPDWTFLEAEFGDDPEDFGAGADGDDAPEGLLSPDEFWGVFEMMHSVPNMVPIPPFPLDSLPIKSEERTAARAASDKIHELAVKHHHLRWLIQPNNEWIGAAIVIGSYVVPKAMAVVSEVKAKSQPPLSKPAPETVTDSGDNVVQGDFQRL